jgi:hypothetical protein
MHHRNKEEEEFRYNQAKEMVHKTVEQSGAITLEKNYGDRLPSSKVDVEMASEEDSSMRMDRQSESGGDLEDLRYKMAVGRGQVVRQSAKSPSGQMQAAENLKKPSNQKLIPTQMLADV